MANIYSLKMEVSIGFGSVLPHRRTLIRKVLVAEAFEDAMTLAYTLAVKYIAQLNEGKPFLQCKHRYEGHAVESLELLFKDAEVYD